MDDDHAVAGEVDVELEPVGAQRQPMVEGQQRILGPQRRAAAMREDLCPAERARGMGTRHSES